MGGSRRPGVLSPLDLNVTAFNFDFGAIGSRIGALAPAFLHASVDNRPPTRPLQELQTSLPRTFLEVLQELQEPLTTSTTNSTGSGWSNADQALLYNGLSVMILCIFSYVTLRMLMACAPRLRQTVLQPRPLSSSERLVFWWSGAFWRPDKENNTGMDHDVMQIRAGVEAAMLMRYTSFMIRFLLTSGLIALPLLLPLFATAAPPAASGLSTLSILHVPNSSPRLNAAAGVAVIITFLHIWMAGREWRAFGRQRHAWLRRDVGAHQAAVVVQCYGIGAAMLGPLELTRLLESALQGHKLRACAELPATKPWELLKSAFSNPRDLPPPVDPDMLLESPEPCRMTWYEERMTSYTKHFLVLLNSRAAASICVESGAQLLGLQLQTRVVPLERHMFWTGLLYTPTGTFTILAASVTLCIFLFFGGVVGVIQGFAQLSVVAKYDGMEWLAEYKGTVGWTFVEGVAPSLVLVLCTFAVLKSGLFQALERLRAPLTHAEIQARTCALVMAFYLVVVLLASVFAGGLYDALRSELHKDGLLQVWASLLRVLSGGLPLRDRFWLHYIISDVMVLNVEILLIVPLAVELLQRVVQCCSNTFGLRSPGARRWADDEMSPDYNGVITFAYARCFFMSAVGIMFAPVAPCMLCGALGYLLIFQPLWARNLSEAYSSPRSDTGGRIWIQAMRYSSYAVALSTLTLCGVLASRGCTVGAVVVACLPLTTLYYEKSTRDWYREMAMRLSLLHCTELDAMSPVDVTAHDEREPEAPQLFAALLATQERRLQEAISKMAPTDWLAAAPAHHGEPGSPLQTFGGDGD